MSYTPHNFKPKQALTAQQLNEMDAQIAESANLIGSGDLPDSAQTLVAAINAVKNDTDTVSGDAVKVVSQTLTASQKAQAIANLGLTFADDGEGAITVS